MSRHKPRFRGRKYGGTILILLAAGLIYISNHPKFLWALLVLAIIPISEYFFERQRINRLRASDIMNIDDMTGLEFEYYLEELFSCLGYRAKKTKDSGDFGADVIIEKNGIKTAVQAKRYKKPVGIRAVQEVISSKAYYNCDTAIVITNNTFTNAAKELASRAGVELWDRSKLIELSYSAKLTTQSNPRLTRIRKSVAPSASKPNIR